MAPHPLEAPRPGRPGWARALMGLCAAVAFGSAAPTGAAERPGSRLNESLISVWVRAPGMHGERAPAGLELKSYDLLALPHEELDRLDPQYGAQHRFRGVRLQSLLDAYGPPANTDLALLHFENGMVVPVPFRDAATMKKLDLFVARTLWAKDERGKEGWRSVFPDLPKKGAEHRDRRPIHFRDNKVVSATRWHPNVPDRMTATFSPWSYVDRLWGIELAQATAYAQQFDLSPAHGSAPNVSPDAGNGTSKKASGVSVQAGRRVFAERCQFCHGISEVGARFGWDFLVPMPLHVYRPPDSLLLHVKYREGNAPERGLMMPAFPDITAAEVGALWLWMEAADQTGPRPYAPSP